ncbi:glycosyltransferase [Flavobacterium gawalongense]|uniref:Glycosyltransferase n=1 Tax=Flavobacterium gawalongense TaxID=2594432 RepID=A0A553BZ43_9FLAO|nr:glycosyltransferase [Flavobacterium gawalongense]TRX04562.1 glycosyltransferase [Flavobacterium gawalongense]TRX10449.1 glycosyltransferase [Flavobacterium gawalongense]TRX13495.1 glycosyltransferase [Flavobacterium gawalongense]TRX15573.1 glycosyltransferase [Flavobacterium gawalongense]TRX31412.1 glycosyltransferase [Flavobacterium gawalongense]
MRILQIIDSLEAGGAERIAVSYANALIRHSEFSGLVVTRKEGPFVNQIDSSVSYLFLNKKKTLDFKAVFRLRNYVRLNKVTIVHAHGTSFFIAFLLKLIYPKVKIIWHEHYGGRIRESIRDNFSLFFSSIFFSSVFVVNHQLEAWAKKNLLVKKVSYIPNFATFEENYPNTTFLKGNDEKRIVCLANLKKPKNHLAILIAFQEMKLNDLGWSLHLIGKDYKDGYSIQLKEFINKNKLENFVFIYGSKNDIKHILSQITIGILASTTEGFPVTLLEYGCAKLPVVSTNVGYCPLIIKDNLSGLLFDPLNQSQLQQQLHKMISEKSLRDRFGMQLQEFVFNNYSKAKVVNLLLNKYKTI